MIITIMMTIFLAQAEHAHQHGHAKLDIAFEGQKGKIELEAPSDIFFGFEYAPKTDAQKKLVKIKTAEVENSIEKMILFDSQKSCKIQKEKTERVQTGKNHSEMRFSFQAECQKPIVGSSVIFNIQSILPKAKDVDVQVIVDSLQKSIEANKNGTRLELK